MVDRTMIGRRVVRKRGLSKAEEEWEMNVPGQAAD